MSITIGTCSECGGRVTIPRIWMSVIPAIPSCEHCGAIPAEPHGPIIKMKPSSGNKSQWRETLHKGGEHKE